MRDSSTYECKLFIAQEVLDFMAFSSCDTFLDNRKQRVIVNEETSEWHNVPSGIPQGSVLGRFVIYTNTLPEMVEDSGIVLFTGDTKAF